VHRHASATTTVRKGQVVARRLRVTYSDGTVTEVTATPKAQVMTERYLRQQGGFAASTVIEATMRLAYEASKPGIGNVGYEEWLEKAGDVQALCTDCGEPMDDDPDLHVCPSSGEGDDDEGPTRPAPSPTPSFD
jgi:hypothetical protein